MKLKEFYETCKVRRMPRNRLKESLVSHHLPTRNNSMANSVPEKRWSKSSILNSQSYKQSNLFDNDVKSYD